MGMRREKRYTFSLSLLWAVCVWPCQASFSVFPLKTYKKNIYYPFHLLLDLTISFREFSVVATTGAPDWKSRPATRKGWNKHKQQRSTDNHLSKTGKKKKMGRCDLMQPKVILFFSFLKEFFWSLSSTTILFQAMCHNISSAAEIIIIFQNKSSPASVVIMIVIFL